MLWELCFYKIICLQVLPWMSDSLRRRLLWLRQLSSGNRLGFNNTSSALSTYSWKSKLQVYFKLLANVFYDQTKNNIWKYSFSFLETYLLPLMFFGKFSLTREIPIPSGAYLFKFNNGNTRVMCEMCSILMIKTQGRRHDQVFFAKIVDGLTAKSR